MSNPGICLTPSRRMSARVISPIMFVIACLCLATICESFGSNSVRWESRTRISQLNVKVLTTLDDEVAINVSSSGTVDWTSNSMGSVLLRLQKEEEEEMRHFAPGNGTEPFEVDLETHKTLPPPLPSESALSPMDIETAKELDDSVSIISREKLMGDIEKFLDLPAEYKQAQEQDTKILQDMPLSKPEHHRDRIGRDMRLVATSIASSVEDEGQWRLFTEENGGVKHLLECIGDGARFMERKLEDFRPSEFSMVAGQYQQSFWAACSACRALRDLCALSPEMSAVLADEMLRANFLWDGKLMKDIVTLLNHAEDAELLFSRLYVYRRQLRFDINPRDIFRLEARRNRRESRRRCKLYVLQLLLAMVVASDDAVDMMRATPSLKDAVMASSSYARKEKVRNWLRPRGLWNRIKPKNRRKCSSLREDFQALDELTQEVQGTANQVLAALGHNPWVPKMAGQKGLRVLSIDGGGTRGVVALSALKRMVEAIGGVEASDCFDIIAGTSTGAIIAFLIGLRRETSKQSKDRYAALIKRIFVKSALSTSTMVFTTAQYDDSHFMGVLQSILGDANLLDSRYDPSVPHVFGVTSIMSSTPTHVALYRNYNYAGGEMPDRFIVDPDKARNDLGLPVEFKERVPKSNRHMDYQKPRQVGDQPRKDGSRHPGSFRVLQRYALRASAAAPTFFKPVRMGGSTFVDGGVVASNPAAVAVHEAKVLFPDVPLELVVSLGTGAASEVPTSEGGSAWYGITNQILNSALDGEKIHHLLEDVWGKYGLEKDLSREGSTRYYRFNPLLGGPNDFPIDTTDPEILEDLSKLTERYMEEPEQQRMLDEIVELVGVRRGWRKIIPW